MTATAPRTDRDLLLDVRSGDRWLVVVAHPDDETFGLGSVIASAARRGAEVTVACATRGEAGEPPAGLPDRTDLGTVREAELHRAAAVLGAARVELLGYRDSGFDGPLGAGSLCAASVGSVADALERLVDDLVPDVVVVLDGSDGHRDHRHVRAATQEMVGRRAAPPQLYEHTLPRSLMRRWLRETGPARGDDAYHALDADAVGRPDVEVTDVLDVAEVLDQREAAIAEHRSQTSPYDGLSVDLRTAFLATDHLVRVPPAGLPSSAPSRRSAMTASPAPETTPVDALPVDALGQPWPEPWRPDRSSRPSTQYWDIETACWHCDGDTGSIPEPRNGD